MSKLTKRIVDGAPPKSAPYFVWCSDLPGFGVRVFPSGKAIYYADYRNKAGIRKRMSIGHHGKLTTEDARKQALATLGDVVKGSDPAEERATRRTSLTVKELCENYFQAAGKGLIMGKGGRPKKASTLDTDRGRVARHVVPLLGSKLVIDLTQADLNRFVRDVASGKTAAVEKTGKLRGKAIVDGGAGTAARTAGMLGGILSFAVSEGVIPFNPARGVKRPADKSRNRRLTPDEYQALGAAIKEAELDGEAWQSLAGARLLALTGCRLVVRTIINGMTFDGATTDPMQMAVRDALIAFMAASAQAQAEATKEAQKAGVAHAQANGAKAGGRAYKGRKPSFSRGQLVQVADMLATGAGIAGIAEATGLTRQTVYRIRDNRAEAEAALAAWAA